MVMHGIRIQARFAARLGLLGLLLAIVAAIPTSWTQPSSVSAQQLGDERLTLTIAPTVLAADGSIQPVIYVQLADAEGMAKPATRDVSVALSSSNPFVAQVPSAIHIPKGWSYAIASVTTTTVPGEAVISATIAGQATATGQVRTVSAPGLEPPVQIALNAAPTVMLSNVKPPGQLTASLFDGSGRLSPAPYDLSIILRSSDPDVAQVPPGVSISKGAIFATVDILPLLAGSTTLSAVSPGFFSEFIEVHVVASPSSQDALKLFVTPPIQGLRSGTRPGLIVQAMNVDGLPALFPCAEISLASSKPDTADVLPLAEFACQGEVQYVTAKVRTNNTPGKGTITGSAEGLRPAVATFEVQGHLPVRLETYIAPVKLLGGQETPGFVIVQVLDGNSVPVTSHSGIPITVIGADGMLPEQAFIPPGGSFVALGMRGPQPARSFDLWFVAPNLDATNVDFQSLALPTTAEVVFTQSSLLLSEETELVVRVQSWDAPLPGATLEWRASHGSLQRAMVTTNAEGEARALYTAQAPGDATVQVSVTKEGYEGSTGQASLPILASTEVIEPSPATFFGIPVSFLFMVMAGVVAAYLIYAGMPAVRQGGGLLRRLISHRG